MTSAARLLLCIKISIDYEILRSGHGLHFSYPVYLALSLIKVRKGDGVNMQAIDEVDAFLLSHLGINY